MTQNNHHKNLGSIPRLKRALIVSIAGLYSAWRGEQAFRLEVCVAAVGIPLAFFLPVSLTMAFILAGSLFLILIVELLNSAIEAIVDLVTDDHHPLAKNAKDMGSAAVLICLIQSGIIWSVVLISILPDL